uniref:Uncharacterized protein n=1 Tax=Cacopsylla melanoneura TaxID=428564 RepID=A0A8D8WDG9_9HEMI
MVKENARLYTNGISYAKPFSFSFFFSFIYFFISSRNNFHLLTLLRQLRWLRGNAPAFQARRRGFDSRPWRIFLKKEEFVPGTAGFFLFCLPFSLQFPGR